MRLFISIVCLLLAAPSFPAQAPSPKAPRGSSQTKSPVSPANRWPIQSLVVEGNPDYPSAQVLAVAGLKIGQVAGEPEFEAARDRLTATGVFETVGYRFEPGPDGKGYRASFQVTEVSPILPVRFSGLGVPDADLEVLLRAKDPLHIPGKLPASRPIIERYTAWIKEYLASKGADGRITGGVAPWPEQLAVVFRPDKDLPTVAEVSFEGEQAVSEEDLRTAVAGAGIGAAYTEERFRDILDHSVRPVYEARGRMRVSFPKLRTEAAKDVKGLHVFVTVDEGAVYKLGKAGIAGPAPLNPEDLIRTGQFKLNEPANFDRIKEGLETIRKTVRRAGYLDASTSLDREIHDVEKTVDISVRIDPGPLYTMRKLDVIGLDLTAEAEIKRMWAIASGKPFNPDYPDLFLTRIREQGVFDNLGSTKAAVSIDYRTHAVDVTLAFAGAPPPAGRRGRP